MSQVEHPFFGSYDAGWETEAGKPGIMYVANAIQFWAVQQDTDKGDATVQTAAAAFNMPEEFVREAVDHHPWMFIGADDVIEHEGE